MEFTLRACPELLILKGILRTSKTIMEESKHLDLKGWGYCKTLISKFSLVSHSSCGILLTCRICCSSYRTLPLHPSPQAIIKYSQKMLNGKNEWVQIINNSNNERSNHVHASHRAGLFNVLIRSIPLNHHKIPIKQSFSTSALVTF